MKKSFILPLILVTCFNVCSQIQFGSSIDGQNTGDEFGHSISFSSDGKRLAIGVPKSDNNGGNSGNVSVFDWNGSNWIQVGSDIDGQAVGDQFGGAVALSSDGNQMAIGAAANDNNGGNSGNVRIFHWDGANWTQVGSDINGQAVGDHFGGALSLSSDGDRIAVGAAGSDANGGNSGNVRIFDWDGTSWIQVGSDINGQAIGDQSGGAISLASDGNRIAIGAAANDNNGGNSGNVRIFDWDGTSWTQVGSDINGQAVGDQSGGAISLSSNGDRVAIGAAANDNNGGNSGHVRVYDWNGSSWIQAGSDINGETVGNLFGTSISLSSDGNRMAVGAVGNATNGGNSGHVRIYDWNGTGWILSHCDINGEAIGDQLGTSVTLSSDGGQIAIGAAFNDVNGGNSGQVTTLDLNQNKGSNVLTNQVGNDIDGEAIGDDSGSAVSLSSNGKRVAIGAINNTGASGHTRVYDWDGVNWTQTGNDIDGEATGDQSGVSISLSSNGNYLAIGATGNDGNGTNAGHTRVFNWDGVNWTQVGNDIDGEAAGDASGGAVSLSADGDRIAIGAVNNNGNTGHVRVYDWDGSAWTQVGSDIDGEAIGDQSGSCVSLSSNGNILAVGAIDNDGNGASAGHVRIFNWNGTNWVQLGSDIDGEAAGDASGGSVALSSDGGRVAIGAANNNGNTGHVRLYDWDGSAWTQVGNDIDGEAASDQSGSTVSLSSDGDRVAIGAIDNDGNGGNAGHVRLYDWDGTNWTQVSTDIDGETAGDQSGGAISLSSNGNRIAVGAVNNNGNMGHARVFDLKRDFDLDGVFDISDLDDDNDGILDRNECSNIDFDDDGFANYLDFDSDDDGCPDVLEAGYTDTDNDEMLGTSPVSVNASGVVQGAGGYMGPSAATVDGVPNGVGCVPLPIELAYFQATAMDNRWVSLAWETISESNNDYFEIHRSVDLENWEFVDKVNGLGNSTTLSYYTTEDASPHSGVSYYRLLQFDFNGSSTYHDIKSVIIHSDPEQLSISPNPTSGKVNVIGTDLDLTHFQLFNSIGKKVQIDILASGAHTFTLDLSNVTPGVYLLKSEDKSYKIIRK